MLLDIKSGEMRIVQLPLPNHDPTRNEYIGCVNGLICFSRFATYSVDHIIVFNPLSRTLVEFMDVEPESFMVCCINCYLFFFVMSSNIITYCSVF